MTERRDTRASIPCDGVMGRGGRSLVARREVLAGLGATGAVVALALGGCRRTEPAGPAGPAAGMTPAVGPDLPQPQVLTSSGGSLDVVLVAASGTVPHGAGTRWALTYNGTAPGPTLRVRPGDVLTVTLENRLDAATNLHTHGLHVSPEGDGDNIFVSVAPGASRTYRYRIPADHPSGTFWYHPHHHGSVAGQVLGGLAGTIIVEDAVDAALAATTSRVLVLSDPVVGGSASVLDVSMMDQMMGREGTDLAVNGVIGAHLAAAAGSTEHWRIVNASPSRFYALRLGGLAMHLMASDGGRLGRPQQVDEVILVPGERAELLVPLSEPGTWQLTTRAVDRGSMGGMGGMGGMSGNRAQAGSASTGVVATLDVGGAPTAPAPLPSVLGEPVDRPADPVGRSRELTFSMPMAMGSGMRPVIDGRAFDAARTDIAVTVGSTEEWVIRNTSPMDHPFHLHVWPFEVIERSDGAPLPRGWKDTVNVPANGSVRLRIPFRDLTGRTVYHCHILDHEDLGMMGVIDVRPA